MHPTHWFDSQGHQLDRDELAGALAHARRVYEANPHIFEDEQDALRALGVVPVVLAGP